MSKQFWAVIIVIGAIFLGVYMFGGNKNNANKSSSTTLTQHIIGSGKSGVTLVEYGDYECPYCEAYYPTVQQVVNAYINQIYFQFRNFPLTSIHANAFAGARAAEAAGLQGKFWQMHDALYDSANWQDWSTASDPTPFFWQYAQQLGLNVTQFKTDFASSKVNDLVTADMNYGNQLGIDATPTFILDGKQITIANDPAAFAKVINAEIAKKAAAAQKTTTTKQ